MHFHSEWFSIILHLNAHELLAFVHILLIVRCHGDHILQTESIITNWCNRSWREDFSDHLFQNDTTPMADVNFTSLVTSCINNVLSLRFVYGCLGDLYAKITAYFKGFYVTSTTASVYFDDADNATCKPRVGLPYSVVPVPQPTIFGFGCERTGAWEHACNKTMQYKFVLHCCEVMALWTAS